MAQFIGEVIVRAKITTATHDIATQITKDLAADVAAEVDLIGLVHEVKPGDVYPDKGEKARFADTQSFDYAQVEGALCVFEHIIESRDEEPYKELLEGFGWSAMRMVAVQAGDICDRAFKHMESLGYEFTGAYDWEFVPDVCRHLDWNALFNDNQYNNGRYDPNIDELVNVLITAEMATVEPGKRLFHKEEMTADDYIKACRAEAERQWGYGDLVSDHPEHITAAMEAGQTPTEITYELGKQFDLTPRDAYLG
ncbi:hypothetical protein J2045_003364 [Peteryoungia aggregata LMG 23059]|uniref:Uncharacterized protein n=1 Tax=Peteryoungia aggregata LMG 23059 TaxID=1368425 RepID=A0ABU0GC67_9HYPH|nr:hypothetical protein [Peteryoungia aggregata]MDQ0422316.1 hypothetical protein [Peteryoungia aggregata LMG 23059]